MRAIMPKANRISIFLFLFIVCAGFFCHSAPVVANSGPPIRPDDGSGIVFRQHEHVKIVKEILNIHVNDNATANISATYTMQNISDQALSVETMFLTPVQYGDNSTISVKQNGTDINFVEQFYGLHDYASENLASAIEDWEAILAGIMSPSEPLGEGEDFWEYQISGSGEEITAKFTPDSHYFAYSDGFRSESNGQVILSNYKNNYSNDAIIVVSSQNINFNTTGTVNKTAIGNIYKYLFDRALINAYDEQLRFADEQFNLYLSRLNLTGDLRLPLFMLNYVESYVSAIIYFVNFAPQESIELNVSYVYQMGTSSYSSKASLLYYLSPAKYWKDFADLQINVTLGDRFKKITSSSVDFVKIADKSYTFNSNTLPTTELTITVKDGSLFKNPFLILAILVIGLPLLGVAALVVVIAFLIKKGRNSFDQSKLL